MNLIGRLICKLWGHKRGKRITNPIPPNQMTEHTYQCPRCGARWTRKAKKEKK